MQIRTADTGGQPVGLHDRLPLCDTRVGAGGQTRGEAMQGETGRAAKATLGAEAIEVKVTVVERHETVALRKFGLEREHAEQRRIFFYDTRELVLYNNGVCLRAREMEEDGCDSTVKIRPVEPERIADRWRRESGFKVEADFVGSEAVCSASFTVEQKPDEISDVATGDRPIAKLFSGEQEDFLKEMARVPVDFAGLVPLGPVAVLRWKFRHEGLPYGLCAEEWRLPDGRDVVEISIKAKPAEAAAAQAALNAFLAEIGIAPETRQQTKTRTALEYFAKGR
jgi:hypothetical protein